MGDHRSDTGGLDEEKEDSNDCTVHPDHKTPAYLLNYLLVGDHQRLTPEVSMRTTMIAKIILTDLILVIGISNGDITMNFNHRKGFSHLLNWFRWYSV